MEKQVRQKADELLRSPAFIQTTYLTVLPALKSAKTFARSASDIAIKPSRSALEPLPLLSCLRNILYCGKPLTDFKCAFHVKYNGRDTGYVPFNTVFSDGTTLFTVATRNLSRFMS